MVRNRPIVTVVPTFLCFQKKNHLKPSCLQQHFCHRSKKIDNTVKPLSPPKCAPKCVITSGNAVIKSVHVDSCCRDSGGAGVDSNFKKCCFFSISLALQRHESELLVCESQSFGEIDLSDVYPNRRNYVKLPPRCTTQPKPDLNNPIEIHFSKKIFTQDVTADLGFEHLHSQSWAELIAQVAGLSIFLASR